MTSQNGSPGQPDNSNLDRKPHADESEQERKLREMGVEHADELGGRAEVPKKDV